MKPVQSILVTHHGSHLETISGVAVASARALFAAGDPTVGAEHPWAAWLTNAYTKVVKRTSEAKIRKAHDEFGGSIAQDPYTGFTVCALPPMLDTDENRKRIPGQVSGVERTKPETHLALPEGRWIALNGGLGMSTGKASAQAAHVRTLMALQGLPQDEEAPDVLWASSGLFSALLEDPRTILISRDNGLTEVAKGSATGLLVEAWS
jgi:hypothetical protein